MENQLKVQQIYMKLEPVVDQLVRKGSVWAFALKQEVNFLKTVQMLSHQRGYTES
jgi:hypothetical protein